MASLRRAGTRQALTPQEGLYALTERQNAAQTSQVIGSIRQILVAPLDPALLAAMVAPGVQIVSPNVTEKGYGANIASGDLQIDDPGGSMICPTPGGADGLGVSGAGAAPGCRGGTVSP